MHIHFEKNGIGFSLNDTIIKAGTESYFWYKNHIEAVYCIEGEGEIEKAETGELFPIKQGTMYLLDEDDKHYLRAKKKCVWSVYLTRH